jgi:glycosyltransferase involved in cell wall biosynthesis
MPINSIALLARDNDVEVLISAADRDAMPVDDWMEPLLVTYPGFGDWLLVRGLRFLLLRLGRRMRLPEMMALWVLGNLEVLLLSRWLARRAQTRKYDILVAVECFSLIAADRAAVPGADLIYYSLELLGPDDITENINKHVLKRLELQALTRVAQVVTTSPRRRLLFAERNGFPAERVSALPVVPLRQSSTPRTRFFRDKFGIGDDQVLVVYSGNFEAWAQCLEIITSMDRWPSDAVLVMHTWNGRALRGPYFKQMRQAAAGRPVYFSTDYMRPADLHQALASADIGLLFYTSVTTYFSEILFSSNKMAEYMQVGLPIVCSPMPELKAFVEDEHIGLAAEFDELGAAIARIAGDLPAHREAVARCRNRHFEFERYFTDALSQYIRAQ